MVNRLLSIIILKMDIDTPSYGYGVLTLPCPCHIGRFLIARYVRFKARLEALTLDTFPFVFTLTMVYRYTYSIIKDLWNCTLSSVYR